MHSYLKFDGQLTGNVAPHGLTFEWFAALFLSETGLETAPRLLQGISPEQKAFAVRQTLATNITYDSLNNRRFRCRDPWVAAAWCQSLVALSAHEQGSLPFGMLPIFYGCRSATGEAFWVCVYGTHGAVTQVFFPSRQLVVFDIFQETAEKVIVALQATLSRNAVRVAEIMAAASGRETKCVGLLDMVTNFAHQAINHLSGVQRIIDLSLLNSVDEVWVSGTLFFGKVELIYPELGGRIRYFSRRWEVANELLHAPCHAVRIGSTYLPAELRRRIIRHVPVVEKSERTNILVITVRTAGRVCVNLPDIVGDLYARLAEHHDLKIALDGWVLPEAAIVTSSRVETTGANQYLSVLRDEMALAEEIEAKLPPGVIVANTIGSSMLDSLNALAEATCYFAHVGTLQHKLGLLLRLPGVVHGPTRQLTNPEGGPYLAEEGQPPAFMPAAAVEDLPTTSVRGASFADYRILDLSFIVENLSPLLRPLDTRT
jgi:hypothetical protein